MANSIPDRANNRPIHARRGGIVSTAEILENIKNSGIPDDAPEGAAGPTMGIRDDRWLAAHRASGKRVGDE